MRRAGLDASKPRRERRIMAAGLIGQEIIGVATPKLLNHRQLSLLTVHIQWQGLALESCRRRSRGSQRVAEDSGRTDSFSRTIAAISAAKATIVSKRESDNATCLT